MQNRRNYYNSMTNIEKTLFNKDFFSIQEKRKEIIEAVLQPLLLLFDKLHLTKDELFLIIDEAVTNAMEHGNHWDSSKKIMVKTTIDSDSIKISIADEGRGFVHGNYMKRIPERNILSTRGRGLYIINQFCDISWNTAGNEILLIFKLK